MSGHISPTARQEAEAAASAGVALTLLRSLGLPTPGYGFSGGETQDAVAGFLT